MVRRFECVEGSARKFWQVEVREKTLRVAWGALGTRGREQEQAFPSAQAASAALEKLVREKRARGYAEVIGSAAPTPRALSDYEMSTIVPRGTHPALVLGFAVSGKQAVAVGGQGRDLLLVSKNGARFTKKKSPGPGLRGALLRENGELWVAGEYGWVACSRDGAKSFKRVKTGASACLFGVVEDEAGRVWTAGDGGFIACGKTGSLEKVSGVSEDLGRLRMTSRGLLIPSDGGHVFEVKGGKVARLPFDAKAMLMALAVTPSGTVIAVGANGALWRLPAGAKKAKRVAAPKVLLTGVDVLADGQVLVVGFGGTALASVDDGLSFQQLDVPDGGALWCCRAHGEGALIGGEAGLIIRWAPRR